MQSRRNFIGKVATGLAGTLAASNVLGANERIRIGIIGPGARGTEILRQALACPNVECIGAADVYTRRLEDVKKIAPDAKTYLDYRHLLDDKDVDAVLIATPQHLHARALHRRARRRQARLPGKDHGVHGGARQAHARRLPARRRQARRADRPPVDLHRPDDRRRQLPQARADGQDHRHPRPHVPQHAARQAAVGAAGLSRHDAREHRLEERSWARRPQRPFDANRYINWRFFWDYSGGNVYENMCHQLAFWYKAMGLGIPRAVTMTGGLYLWKDGREVPDTMNVSMEHDEEMLFTWDSGFGNERLRRHRRRAGRQRHHLAHASRASATTRKR